LSRLSLFQRRPTCGLNMNIAEGHRSPQNAHTAIVTRSHSGYVATRIDKNIAQRQA
jgi:hypothetical protein